MTELCLPGPKYFPRESFVQYCNLRSLRVRKKTSQSHQTVGKITVQSYRFVCSISSVLYTEEGYLGLKNIQLQNDVFLNFSIDLIPLISNKFCKC